MTSPMSVTLSQRAAINQYEFNHFNPHTGHNLYHLRGIIRQTTSWIQQKLNYARFMVLLDLFRVFFCLG
jgi:hypothetical protein